MLAKQGKPAQDWCVETRSEYDGKLAFKLMVTDDSQTARPTQGLWRKAGGTLNPICGNIVTTPAGGQVKVWLDDVRLDGVLLTAVPPPCDPGEVTVAPRLTSKGEILALTIKRGDETITLSRRTLLSLRHKLKKKLDAPVEKLFYLGGSGDPAVTYRVLAQQYCRMPSPPTLQDEVMAKMKKTLEDAVRIEIASHCAKEKDPTKCEQRLRKKTRTSEGSQG